jgi:hypothetical protein
MGQEIAHIKTKVSGKEINQKIKFYIFIANDATFLYAIIPSDYCGHTTIIK